MNWLRLSQINDTKSKTLERANRYGNEITPDGFLIVYHGTRFYKQIKASGFFRSGTYFGDTFEDSAHHGWKPWEQGVFHVMKVKVLPDEVSGGSFLSAIKPIPIREVEPAKRVKQ